MLQIKVQCPGFLTHSVYVCITPIHYNTKRSNTIHIKLSLCKW